MRNPFDQYTQPENKLTHALATSLASDQSLLRSFIDWAGARDVPRVGDLRITQQQVPGVLVSSDDEDEGRGLPDAAVFDDDGWVLLVESKVQAGIDRTQLERHLATARRYGFESPQLLVLAVDGAPPSLPQGVTHREWRELYCWLRDRADTSYWARTLAEYFEVFESKMVAHDYDIRGTLTMFDGLRFDDDNPYTYREGKRLIRLLGDELQGRRDLQKIGVDPSGARRGAITGRAGTQVWDFLPLRQARFADSFTAVPHLKIDLGEDGAQAAIVVPNGVRGGFRTALQDLGEDDFLALLSGVEQRARPVLKRSEGARVTVSALQRHFRSQRSRGEVDAQLSADLRTIRPGKRREAKFQPQWAKAIYDVLIHKRSNIQFGVAVNFSYDCPVIRSRGAVDLFAEAWIAMSPVLDLALPE